MIFWAIYCSGANRIEEIGGKTMNNQNKNQNKNENRNEQNQNQNQNKNENCKDSRNER